MAALEFSSKGFDEVESNLATLANNDPRVIAAVLYQEAQDVMSESVADYVPRDEGTLAGTGHVKEPEIKKTGAVVVMGYGSFAVRYAAVQHESLHFKHKVGEAKYLEKPLLKSKSGMKQRMAARVHRIRKRSVR